MLNDSNAFSGFSVNDMEAAAIFYKDVLGLDVERNDMGMELHLAGGNKVFVYQKDDHQPATFTVLNFPVTDIDQAVQTLIDKGVVMERYELGFAEQDDKGILRGRTAGMGPDIAWFKDPAGNVLSILEDD